MGWFNHQAVVCFANVLSDFGWFLQGRYLQTLKTCHVVPFPLAGSNIALECGNSLEIREVKSTPLKLALKDPENGYEMDMNHYEINFWCLWFCYRISIQFKNAHTAKPALCGCASVVKVSKYLVEVTRILMWANFKKSKQNSLLNTLAGQKLCLLSRPTAKPFPLESFCQHDSGQFPPQKSFLVY